MTSITPEMDAQIEAVRAFNRFYVRQLGLLEGGLLKGSFSLTQMHVLYELAHNEGLTASRLGRELVLDAGYLSRILKKFEEQKLITRTPSKHDARQSVLAMTKKGRKTFEPLDQISREKNAAMLAPLSTDARDQVVSAMRKIHRSLADVSDSNEPYLLRQHEAGDIGWITYRHGVLYNEAYGWDETFEALVANILAEFVQSFNPKRERSWIAERDGEIVGSIFCMFQSNDVAQLRVFYVEPCARGNGIGRRLVNECVRFARSKKYRKLTLRTVDVLESARRIYEEAGFVLSAEEGAHDFGHDVVNQDWELKL